MFNFIKYNFNKALYILQDKCERKIYAFPYEYNNFHNMKQKFNSSCHLDEHNYQTFHHGFCDGYNEDVDNEYIRKNKRKYFNSKLL